MQRMAGALKGTDANPAMVDLFNEDTNFWNLEALSLFDRDE